MVSNLVPIYFGSTQLEHATKITSITLQTVKPKYVQFLFFRKGPATSLSITFVFHFSREMILMLIDVYKNGRNVSSKNECDIFYTKTNI